MFQSSGIKNIVIPPNVESFGTGVFNGSQLESIAFLGPIETLGAQTFYNCENLKIIRLPASLTAYYSGSTGETFRGCENLETVIFPDNAKTIPSSFFEECYSLKTLVIPSMGGTLNTLAFSIVLNDNTKPRIAQTTFYTRPGSTVKSLVEEKEQLANPWPKVNVQYLGAAPQITAQAGSELVFADTARFTEWEFGNDFAGWKFASDYDAVLDRPATLSILDVTAYDALVSAHGAKYGEENVSDYLAVDADGNVTKAFGADTNGTFGFTVNGEIPSTELASTAVTDTDAVHFYLGAGLAESGFTRDGMPLYEITMLPKTGYTVALRALGNPIANAEVFASLSPDGDTDGFTKIGTTNASGEITLNFETEGKYIVYAKRSGYAHAALRITLDNADTRLGSITASGDVPFETRTKLESGVDAGTFVKTSGTTEGTASFASDHTTYNYYVNKNISELTFGLTANQAIYEQGMTLAVAVDGEPLEDFTAAAPDAWASIPVTLAPDTTTTAVTFTVTYVEEDEEGETHTYTRTYNVNVIKSELGAYSWFIDQTVDTDSRTRPTGLYFLHNAPADSGLIVYKGDQNAEVSVKISAGNKLYIDGELQTSPTAANQEFGLWRVDEYDLSLPVPQDLSGMNPNRLSVASYAVTVETPEGESTTQNINVYLRSHYDGIFTPDRVVNYNPAAGQFVNADYSPYVENVHQIFMSNTHYMGYITHLGGFGGYVTAEYDEPITNDPNNPYGVDFIVYGNAFEGGKASEPGSVEVSYDGDNWYYLAGSNHYELNVSSKDATLTSGKVVSSMVLLRETGYPNVTFGYADVSSCSEEANANYVWAVKGEVYNPYTADLKGSIGDGFDLSWAVDGEGRPVDLPDGIKYIRIQNITDVPENSVFGEVSPEISTIIKIRPQDQLTPVGVTDAPSSIRINGKTFDELELTPVENYSFNDGQITYYELNLFNVDVEGGAFTVSVEGADENDNIYVNATRGVGALEYNALLDKDGSRTFRVITQNGEKAARVYVIKSANGGDPDDNTDIDSITLTPSESDGVLSRDENGRYIGSVTDTDSIALTVKALNYESAITLSGDGIEPLSLIHGEASQPIPVKYGLNHFTVTITSANGKLSELYDVVILRNEKVSEPDVVIPSEPANTDLLSITMNPGGVELAQDNTGKYIGTFALDNGSVELRFTALNPNATITLIRDSESLSLTPVEQSWVSGPINLGIGLNKFTVQVVSADGQHSEKYEVVIIYTQSGTGNGNAEIPEIVTGGNNGEGGNGVKISVGIGKIVTDSSRIENIDTIKTQLSNAGVLLKAASTPVTVEMNGVDKDNNNSVAAAVLDALDEMGLSRSEAMKLVENGIIKLIENSNGNTSIVSNSEAVLDKMPEAERSAFYKTEEFEPLLVELTEEELGELSSDGKAVISVLIENAFENFTGVPVSDICVFKLEDDGKTVHYFKRAEFSGELGAGQYILTNNADPLITMAPSARLEGNELLFIAIKDDSELDYNKKEGRIFDPLTVGAGEMPLSDTNSGGGGCDAGFGAGAMLLLTALGLCLRGKNK